MGIEAVQQNSTILSAGKANSISNNTNTVSNGTIQMVQQPKGKTIKEYRAFTPSSDKLSKEAYAKEQTAYEIARVNYYVKEFKSHGILQKEKTAGFKIGSYKLTAAKDGYKIDAKAMQKALGESRELTLGDLKSYLGLPDGYIRKHVGDLPGDMDTYPASNLDFVDADVINTRHKK